MIQRDDGYTPTPVISHAILSHNKNRSEGLADGIVVTPSHNPPEDGGFKYNPPNGGPADTQVTRWIQDRANLIMMAGNKEVKRMSYESALKASTTHSHDFVTLYLKDLINVVDMDCISSSGVAMGVDPLGGSSIQYWEPIKSLYKVNITVVNAMVDPRFSFVPVDHDGKIRMDCSSPFAMAGLVSLKDRYQVSFANDTDADRHGIVTRSIGLMNPNHYLAVAIYYLLTHRPQWPKEAAVGKTLVSSSIIDRVVATVGRRLTEVPVGFKWFVEGLFEGSCCFGGEESAGASFLKKDGTVWTTDKDGLIMNLLAAEITARTGKDPGEIYKELIEQLGYSWYTRVDAPISPDEKAIMANLTAEMIVAKEIAGEPITEKLTKAPGNGASIGGLKILSSNGWFAVRPSGTENIYKIYAESFKSESHLQTIVNEAQQIVKNALTGKTKGA
jgi:phosphoglucomutase